MSEELSQSQISALMRQMGRKGGRIGGKRRMHTLSPERRIEIARQGGIARWSKRRKPAVKLQPKPDFEYSIVHLTKVDNEG